MQYNHIMQCKFVYFNILKNVNKGEVENGILED